jgi:hypothetical protein
VCLAPLPCCCLTRLSLQWHSSQVHLHLRTAAVQQQQRKLAGVPAKHLHPLLQQAALVLAQIWHWQFLLLLLLLWLLKLLFSVDTLLLLLLPPAAAAAWWCILGYWWGLRQLRRLHVASPMQAAVVDVAAPAEVRVQRLDRFFEGALPADTCTESMHTRQL